MCADHGLGSSISLEKGDDQQPAAIGFWLRASISIPSDLLLQSGTVSTKIRYRAIISTTLPPPAPTW